MKNLWLSATCALLLCIGSCKKENPLTPPSTELTLAELVSRINGIYTTTAICTSGSMIDGYTTDTLYNVPLVVASLQDTTLYVNNRQLFFSGNLKEKNYYFYSPSSGGGYHARADSSLSSLYVQTWDGGLGGGSGCQYSGTKQ